DARCRGASRATCRSDHRSGDPLVPRELAVTAVLELDGVSKRFRTSAETVEAVRGVSLTVSAGEIVALYGPSGSGKSTLLCMAAGFVAPDEGVVRYCGTNLGQFSRREREEFERERL